MTTVYFYYSFPTVPTDISNTTKYKRTKISSNTQPCSSDIEYDCIMKNMFSNWTIGGAYCVYNEKCSSCCSGGCTGCNKTCRSNELWGVNCKGYAGEGRCGCTAGGQTITRLCEYNSFTPPTDTLCHPGATSVVYISGRKDTSGSAYYVFKATYNVTTFTTLSQITTLEANLRENDDGLTSDQKSKNTEQLNILKTRLCTASNLLTEPCLSYCAVNTTGSLPNSNCPDAWGAFCKYADNIGSRECAGWCSINNGSSRCDYLAYCDNPSNFTKDVCKNFYRTQYVNNQLSSTVSSLLTKQCLRFADADGNVLDPSGQVIQPGTTSNTYPANVCSCFLPNSVYSKFYDTNTKDYPELRKFFTINQCSYPDCANTSAVQPQKMTCPDVAITSCIVNNTIGGNVTNSNFSIVNNCITQVENTGTYTNNNTNIAPSEKPIIYEKAVIPAEEIIPDTGSGSTNVISGNDNKTYLSFIGVLLCVIVVLLVMMYFFENLYLRVSFTIFILLSTAMIIYSIIKIS